MTENNVLNPDRIAAKYIEERDKRLRNDGLSQYIRVELDSEADADPFVSEVIGRDPVIEEVEVLVVGGGFAGLMSAANLMREGVTDLRIVERAAGFGGTWYWNRYPGIGCDVEASIYLPLIEDIGTVPTQRYIGGTEIRSHASAIAEKYELAERTLFQTRVDDLTWDDTAQRWIATTTRGDRISAHHVVLGTGGLISRPKLPGIPGIETFAGVSFHTSRWNYDYTGGNEEGGLTGLKEKRVAIVGTGATALQVVPNLAESADQLFVFQRTPAIVDVRDNRPVDASAFVQQEAGWQQRKMASFDGLLAGLPMEEDLVGDQWTKIWGLPRLEIPTDGTAPDMGKYLDAIRVNDLEQMERVRARVDEIVIDPETAASLKPWFATHCKRPGFHDSYLQAFNRPNVTLVDTQGRGAEKITENAIWFDGKAYEVDCIVYATGFEAAISPGRAGGFEIRGRNGVTLEDRWAEGVRNLHGIYTHGFPNLHLVGGVRGAAISININYVNGAQAQHIARVIRKMNDRGVGTFEITAEAEELWATRMAEKSAYNEEASRACTPGYYNNEGDFEETPLFAIVYGGGPLEYIEILQAWRECDLSDSPLILIDGAEPSRHILEESR